MPHWVETMFSVKQAPWHKEGRVLFDWPGSVEEAQELSGLNWIAEEKPMFFEGSNGNVAIPGYKSIVRDTDDRVLGIVSDKYKVVQNNTLFEFAEALVEIEGQQTRFETAGSLKNGRLVWVLCELPNQRFGVLGTDDETKLYVLTFNGFDGLHTFKCLVTTVRTVCWNTLRSAINKKITEWSIRHVGDVMTKVEDAQTSLGLAIDWSEEFRQLANHLAGVPMTDEEFIKFGTHLFPTSESDSDKKIYKQEDNMRKLGIYYVNTCGNFPTLSNTRYCALQSATEFSDWGYHPRKDKQDSRFKRSMIEQPTMKKRALDFLLQPTI